MSARDTALLYTIHTCGNCTDIHRLSSVPDPSPIQLPLVWRASFTIPALFTTIRFQGSVSDI
jgi:hypothetical protein